jgi:hypothetical protein
MARHHVVITGTGRAGTTFLVQLLTRLGMGTGFTLEELEWRPDPKVRGGMERDIRREDCPYIAKDPLFCVYASEVLSRPDIVVDHVFIPMRDLQAAAESRRYVHDRAFAEMSPQRRLIRTLRRKAVAGGLVGTRKAQGQETALLERIYSLCLALSDVDVPVTLLRYPRLVTDHEYLFKKLSPILDKIGHEQFRAAFEASSHSELVHSFNPKDSC